VTASRPWFVDRLRCPTCAGEIVGSWDADGLSCAACHQRFPLRDGQLACVVSSAVRSTMEFPLHQSPVTWPAHVDPPDDAYKGPISPRTNRRHLGVLVAHGRNLDVLDWGCGEGEYRAPIAGLGHRYLGIDTEGRGADVLADVHSLPFRDASFDHAITNAVLEHVANPFIAIREVARVLRPGGVFSGSVAFLEPYHLRSHFHLAPDGVVHVLSSAGLRVEALWPQEHWSVFDSLATMHGPISAPSRVVLRLLARVERILRTRYVGPREFWTGRWLRRKSPAAYHAELLAVTGQVDFVARKA
jgi:SAM-dependent methyltransferase